MKTRTKIAAIIAAVLLLPVVLFGAGLAISTALPLAVLALVTIIGLGYVWDLKLARETGAKAGTAESFRQQLAGVNKPQNDDNQQR